MIHSGEGWTLITHECVAALKKLRANRVDAIVTDPPYELGFMGKAWDAAGIAFSVELWREVLRVLKPGGHMLAFGGTRTYHRMTCAIEDAGFEVRDSLHWMYGTGFPKSLTANTGMPTGQGTALKPGHEPIVLARKPLEGTVAANVAKWGTGGLNIDGCRIGYGNKTLEEVRKEAGSPTKRGGEREQAFGMGEQALTFNPSGRWPANVLLDEDAAAELDAQSGVLKSGARTEKGAHRESHSREGGEMTGGLCTASEGGASRFFYVAKPSRKERDQGCEHLPPKSGGEATDRVDGSIGTENPRAGAGRTGGARNYHPTVKPVELMRYLVRLVTPAGGVVLDSFTGSGTTGIAARLEGAQFIGIEREPEYIEIAAARIGSAA